MNRIELNKMVILEGGTSCRGWLGAAAGFAFATLFVAATAGIGAVIIGSVFIAGSMTGASDTCTV